jgi:signal transduction histidine kinase
MNGQPYSDDDLETLTILAGQTGTALENARLVDDLRDVQDDLRHLTSQLAETNRQLKRLDQTKTDFITIASHELRTPLTQIYGYSDVLKSLEGDELSDAQVVHRFIEGIARGATRLKQVVDAMVDMSLIETKALRLRPATVPVGVVVENAVESVLSAAGQRSLGWRVHDLSDLPCIEADGTRLEQVLVGLLTNAVKFTPDNGAIEISGRLASSSDQSYVELQIADTGIGVDPDHRDLIFEKFYRAENPLLHSTDETGFKGAGPGLGLAIAKGIVEAHGGLIWVESPGRNEKTCPGSTFHIQLPVNGPRLE